MSTIHVILRVQFNDDAYTEWHLQKREVALTEKGSATSRKGKVTKI